MSNNAKTAQPSDALENLSHKLHAVLDPVKDEYAILINIVELKMLDEDGAPALYFINGRVDAVHAQILDLLCAMHGEAMTQARCTRIAKVLTELQELNDQMLNATIN